jgi:sortase A
MGENIPKKSKFTLGKLLMILGILLVVGAVLLFAYNEYDSVRAGRESAKSLAVIKYRISSGDIKALDTPTAEPEDSAENATESEDAEEEAVPTIELDGNYYMGILTIPKLGRELPVQSSWSMEQLKNSPCRYSGSLDEGLVICAHNYRQRHFGGLATLEIGDSVVFTTLLGTEISYEVVKVETVAATDIEGMIESGYDLTLFTCNYGGKARVAVRCSRAD